MDAEVLKAIQIIALREAELDTFSAFYNRVCRWYSREFSTPLSDVENMSEEKVFQVYFQDIVSKLLEDTSEEGRQSYERYRKHLITPELVEQEDVADDSWVNEMNQKVEQEQEAAKAEPDELSERKPNLIPEELQHQDIFIQGEESDFSEDYE